jgi:U3 small nucleolar RNA-associated protein 13
MKQIRIFNTNGFNYDILYGHSDIVLCLDRSNDGSLLVSGSKDNTVRVWAVDLGEGSSEARYPCIAVCVGHIEAVGAVAFSRKSTSFVITGSQDCTIKCWDLSGMDCNAEEGFRPRALFTNCVHDKDINSGLCTGP